MTDGAGEIGGDQFLYLDTGTHDTPVWVLINKAKDVSWPIDFTDVAVDARDSKWKLHEAGKQDLELTFNYQVTKGPDAVRTALETRALARTETRWAIANGPIATSGTRYLRFYGKIFTFGNEEPLDDAKTHDFTIRPCRFEDEGVLVEPEFVTVSA